MSLNHTLAIATDNVSSNTRVTTSSSMGATFVLPQLRSRLLDVGTGRSSISGSVGIFFTNFRFKA
jgi:hypothetical protein